MPDSSNSLSYFWKLMKKCTASWTQLENLVLKHFKFVIRSLDR